MAAPNKIYALNLGMQTLTLAEFSTSASGSVSLNRFQSTELLADPGADASRPSQIQAALAQLRKALSAKPGVVNYALPSQSVFSRYLSLPGSSYEELNSIIGFEAQQNVPFPIDEVVWDYQALGLDKDGKMQVVLVAIKADTLSSINDAIEANLFEPDIIDVAPMSLYNAFRYNYSDLKGCSLLIDIGARTTNLIFIQDTKAYSRSVPIGGNAITAALAKEFGESVDTAETVKREKGFVGLGGSYAESEDQTVAKIAKLTRTTLTRLHAEIARSISFYRANQGGAQPLRSFLAGGTVGMPYMVEFFTEKLQMPVEFFNPFRNVNVKAGVNQAALSKSAHAMGEVVGLALRNIGNTPVEVNLPPPSVVRAHDVAKRKPYLIAAAVCLFLALGQWIAYFTKASEVKGRVLSATRSEVTELEKWANQYDAAAKAQKDLESVAAPLTLAVATRAAWNQLIDDLNARLPKDSIWITQMTPLSNGQAVSPAGTGGAQRPQARSTPQPAAATAARPGRPGQPQGPQQGGAPSINELEIRGLYIQNPKQTGVIDEFVNNLAGSPLFDIKDKNAAVKQRSNPDEESWAYAYRLILPLKNSIPLQ